MSDQVVVTSNKRGREPLIGLNELVLGLIHAMKGLFPYLQRSWDNSLCNHKPVRRETGDFR